MACIVLQAIYMCGAHRWPLIRNCPQLQNLPFVWVYLVQLQLYAHIFTKWSYGQGGLRVLPCLAERSAYSITAMARAACSGLTISSVPPVRWAAIFW